MPELQTQRIESLKAGGFAGLTFVSAYLLLALFNQSIFSANLNLYIPTATDWLIRGVIAFLSGFLFGVTYRYIRRNDSNPHLRDGAVLAFALVRGLATVEIVSNFWAFLPSLGILTIESILCFSLARFTLDFALDRQWLQPQL